MYTDINECMDSNVCHHYCNNTEGSYNCYCQSGYHLLADEITCQSNNYHTYFNMC